MADEVAQMAQYFPRWLLTVAVGRELHRCRSCQAFFVDAEVEARCLDCGQAHAPDKLRVREVRHFRLAEAGRESPRTKNPAVMNWNS